MTTVLGLALGCSILVAALLIGHVPLATIFQPEALLIVFGGTITALLVHFKQHEIIEAVTALWSRNTLDDYTAEDIADAISDAARYIRANGLLAVQPLLSHIEIPFLQKGLQLLVDNQPVEHIEAQLTTEMEVAYQRALNHAKVLEAAGGLAPTMGIIGAVVGLIQVMGLFAHPDQMGHGVAHAFVATLYGVAISNLVLLPLAGKLKQEAKAVWFLQSMMIQGLTAISTQANPRLVQDRMEAYLVGRTPQLENTYDDAFEPVGVML
jgi:chemotaxis protein MotA